MPAERTTVWRFNGGMPRPTRRRDQDRREECWLIYCGDVHIGAISMRTGNSLGGDPWQ
jgi:hypothetical protein